MFRRAEESFVENSLIKYLHHFIYRHSLFALILNVQSFNASLEDQREGMQYVLPSPHQILPTERIGKIYWINAIKESGRLLVKVYSQAECTLPT
ncbi:hypothetical protein CEXT_454851 [Caerostris extrusa]|uniref:Uncharacterized protein n=1 Tax=Caerostris extrusa TaxID=172846 RepID=A0AAV4MVK4_CAEEX|nr:hypothetical protein CEXT_454851 [Caerostris extrusa]